MTSGIDNLTLPAADQAPPDQDEHWVCPHCSHWPEFGQEVVTLCGRTILFDRWTGVGGSQGCAVCVAIHYCPRHP